MSQVISRDGTTIAFDKSGQGPALIIVNGAMGYRAFYGDKPLVSKLSNDFTVYTYDRRGRGESGDTKPYAVEREIEDIEAMIDDANGTAFLYGVSSGAALALLAAARVGPKKVPRLALYEPPYGSDKEEEKADFAAQKKRINELIRDGEPGDAASFFVTALGTPPEALDGLRKSPDWAFMKSVDHTLAYDYEVLGDGAIPVGIAKTVRIPTLVMNGGKSFDFMRDAAESLSKVMPNARWEILKNQTHEVSADAIAPLLKDFFAQDEVVYHGAPG
jgi:pimeloyl-ACP methyl ester carboxylesterase